MNIAVLRFTQQHFKCDVIQSNEAREEGDGGVEKGNGGHEGDDDGGHVQRDRGALCCSPKTNQKKISILRHFFIHSYFYQQLLTRGSKIQNFPLFR